MQTFSIVIPVFNGEKYIEDTLISILNQSFKDYEIIVVDGCSTDGTLKKIMKYYNRIKTLISEPDNGMYDALNKGFKISTGDYLCYINSDDRLRTDALEKVFKKFTNGNYDFIFGDVAYISSTGAVLYKYNGINLPQSCIKYLHRLPFAQQSTFWTRNSFYEAGEFDSSLKYSADTKYFLSLYLNPSIKRGYIHSVLGEFRIHNESFSIRAAAQMEQENSKMLKAIKDLRYNILLKIICEIITKVINIPGISKKKIFRTKNLNN
jgi:glycosyltransferase